jgi:hypothetical protein
MGGKKKRESRVRQMARYPIQHWRDKPSGNSVPDTCAAHTDSPSLVDATAEDDLLPHKLDWRFEPATSSKYNGPGC